VTRALTVSASGEGFARAIDHLQRRSENAAFFLAAQSDSALEIVETRLLTEDDVEAGGWHLELTEEARLDILQWASRSELSLVEAHSHGKLGDPARFSPTDVMGLREWVSHLRWRLPGRTYGALVVGFHTFDGVAWLPEGDAPIGINSIEAKGDDPWIATGRSIADFRLTEEVPDE
jgi:hypothetical protein